MDKKIKENVIIAISGQSGCGNTTVTGIISEKLNLKMINYTFHTMADELDIDFDELCRIAEHDDKYDLMVDNKQVELASKGNCVLGSRLAIWMMKNADLKVYLTADPKVRAKRILQREGGDIDAQIKKTESRDLRDSARYKKLYDIDNTDYSMADLVIDTSVHDQYEVADIIIKAVYNIK